MIINRSISTGNFYICDKCGEEFFISWNENNCQCGQCVDDLCPDCKEKIKQEKQYD